MPLQPLQPQAQAECIKNRKNAKAYTLAFSKKEML